MMNKNHSETNYAGFRFNKNQDRPKPIEQNDARSMLMKHQNFLKNLGVDEKHIPDNMLKEKSGVDERGYDKIMDQHALHVFMIRKGKIIQETPEFVSFKRVIGKDLHRIVPFLLT